MDFDTAQEEIRIFNKGKAQLEQDKKVYECLNKIESCDLYTEKELCESLSQLELILDDHEKIPYSEYSKLLYYLLIIENKIGIPTNNVIEKMIVAFSSSKESYTADYLSTFFINADKDIQTKANSIITEMMVSQWESKKSSDTLILSKETIDSVNSIVTENPALININGSFLTVFGANQIIDFLRDSDPLEINCFGSILNHLYGRYGCNVISNQDQEILRRVKNEIEPIKESSDKVKKYKLQLISDYINISLSSQSK